MSDVNKLQIYPSEIRFPNSSDVKDYKDFRVHGSSPFLIRESGIKLDSNSSK